MPQRAAEPTMGGERERKAVAVKENNTAVSSAARFPLHPSHTRAFAVTRGRAYS